ncbi:MAG TPA: hypothetical protein P5031_06905 [Candidatus Syntrophosphaera sp.]|nr:hypothetical protein [Candidatus Syntrophosphaera sp.]HRS74765.1 hypothetical protein [Anaerolineaceae bacterium]
MGKQDIPQCEHVFLLIGTNPLPNYVAAKLLLKPNGHIYLVHTDETAEVADRLIAALQIGQVTKIQVKEAESTNISEQVANYVQGKQDVGLNYTGGTKAMVVHAYRAMEKHCPKAVFSYLDAQTLCMIVDNQPERSYCVALLIQPAIETILALHGYTLQQKPATEPFKPEVAQNLAQTDLAEWRDWCDKNLRNGPDTRFRSNKDLTGVSLFSKIDWQGAQTLNDLAAQWGKKAREVAEWLDGKWLENYTLWSLQQIANSCQIHESAVNIITKERNFEFDVAAMRGYQLFAISCSTETRKSKLKLKLFEAYIRARQMGGDEARVGLVCCAPQDNSDSNPAAIQREIEESWDAVGKVRVFGAEHLPDLPRHLQDWFNSQPL